MLNRMNLYGSVCRPRAYRIQPSRSVMTVFYRPIHANKTYLWVNAEDDVILMFIRTVPRGTTDKTGRRDDCAHDLPLLFETGQIEMSEANFAQYDIPYWLSLLSLQTTVRNTVEYTLWKSKIAMSVRKPLSMDFAKSLIQETSWVSRTREPWPKAMLWRSEYTMMFQVFTHIVINYVLFAAYRSERHGPIIGSMFLGDCLCKSSAVAEMGHRGHNRHRQKRWERLLCPFRAELGPRFIQCGLGRGLLPYQVASSSIQPFGHNKHKPKIGWWWACPLFWW